MKQNLSLKTSFEDGTYEEIIEEKKMELNEINELLYKKHTHLFSLKKETSTLESELSSYSQTIEE